MTRRIFYLLLSQGREVQGGHKMIIRHVETLRELGFDAHVYIGQGSVAPNWLEHTAALSPAIPLSAGDIVVLPDDAREAIRVSANAPYASVLFSQNPYYFAYHSLSSLQAFSPEKFPTFLTVAPGLRRTLGRLFPDARVETVRCFADERRFQPAKTKQALVACSPRKRPIEAVAIRQMFGKLHPEHADLEWREFIDAPEHEVAQVLAQASLHLSLSRLESVGMTPLEAMAAGCVCAGFTGVGGQEYATSDNGFWVADDDCEAAADALAEAAALVRAGGPPLRRRLEAGFETARQWSYAAFRAELEQVWMRLAPDARIGDGPLAAA